MYLIRVVTNSRLSMSRYILSSVFIFSFSYHLLASDLLTTNIINFMFQHAPWEGILW